MARLARAASRNPDFLHFVRLFDSIDSADAFIRSHYRYRDEREEIVRSPEFMLRDLHERGYLEGDCDDIATFYAAVLASFGAPVRLVAIRYHGNTTEFEHVYAEGRGIAEWRIFDGTVMPGTVIHSLERMIEDV